MKKLLLAALFTGAVLSQGCNSVQSSSPPPQDIRVTIQDKPSNLPFGTPAIPLGVTVTNDAAARGVTWTIAVQGGGACTDDLCGILNPSSAPSFAAAYTAPLAAPPQGSVTVLITATSVSDSTKSDSFTLAYAQISSPSLLKGGYTFLLRGFSSSGVPVALAGTAIADGQGNITSGTLDLNQGGVETKVNSPLAGTYTIDTSFHGTTHGTLNITSFTVPGGGQLSLRFFLGADGKTGGIIEHGTSGLICSGQILLQDSAALSAGTPSGAYAFGLDSDAPVGSRTVENGRFVLSNGTVTSGLADLSRAGNAAPLYSGAAIASGSATAPDANGRGTLQLTISGNTTQYAYYISNSQQLLLLETDAGAGLGTLQAGIAHQQQSLTAGSVNTTSVIQLTGLGTPSGAQNVGTSIIIGQLKISGGNSASVVFDSNDLGTILTTQQVSGQVASFDPSTGRGTVSLSGGFAASFLNSAVFYLYDTGRGFVIDGDVTAGGVVNKAFSGTLVPQQAPPVDNTAFSGNLVILSGGSSANNIPSIVAASVIDNKVQSITGLGDLNSIPSQQGLDTSRTFVTVYQVTNSALGHGNALLPAKFFGNFSLNQPAPCTFYVIGPNQAVVMGTLSGTTSGVTFIQP